MTPSSLGHCSEGSFNQEGPSHHFDVSSLSTLQPSEGYYAGFSLPCICLHSSLCEKLSISFTLLCTKVPHFSPFLIQISAVVESDQTFCGVSTRLWLFFILVNLQTSIQQDVSSGCGVVILFKVATFALAIDSCTPTPGYVHFSRTQWLHTRSYWHYRTC